MVKTLPLEPELHSRVQMIIDRARRSGVPAPTRLNDAQLLWTKAMERQLRVETVRDLILEFQVWRPHEFLRLVNRELINCTPADMHQAIQQFLDSYLEHVKAR
jgi:hypothetical protein